MNARTWNRATRGFSLVELMVGIVVAMAAIVVVMQIFRVSEGQRRATTGGDDAQTTAAIVLHQLQHEVRQSGQGFTDPSMLGCDLDLGTGVTLKNIAPVTINAPNVAVGDPNTDTLLVGYGSSIGSPEGTLIVKTVGASYQVATSAGILLNTFVVATPAARPAPCALKLAKVTAAPGGATTVNVDKVEAGVDSGGLMNLGNTPGFLAFAVRGGKLVRCDFLTHDCASPSADNWAEMADGVVSLRAEYARDTGGFDQVTPVTCATWLGVVGVRVAVVAQSSQFNADEVTQAAPTWSGSASSPISLDGDWKHYRYKTYQTVVPARNLVSLRAANVDPTTGLLTPPC